MFSIELLKYFTCRLISFIQMWQMSNPVIKGVPLNALYIYLGLFTSVTLAEMWEKV